MTREAVADLVAVGLTDKQIARKLKGSVKTVEYHIGRICDEWGIERGHNIRVQITRHVLNAPRVSPSSLAA